MKAIHELEAQRDKQRQSQKSKCPYCESLFADGLKISEHAISDESERSRDGREEKQPECRFFEHPCGAA